MPGSEQGNQPLRPLPHPPGAVIFDMDGVLLDSEPLYLKANNRALARWKVQMTEEDNQAFIGRRLDVLLDWMIERYGIELGAEALRALLKAEVDQVFAERIEPSDGALELTQQLAAAGIPLAVGSSSARHGVEAIVTRLGFRSFFPVLVGGDEVVAGKPAPDIFLAAADRLGVAPARCVVIEDSPAGVEAANRAGMASINLRTPATARLVFPPASAVVASLRDVAELLGIG